MKVEKYPTKEWVELSGKGLAEKLRATQFPNLVKHFYSKREQSSSYKSDKENLQVGEALVHVDYSENYKNKNQREIKSAYYGCKQFSLYTVCTWVKETEEQPIQYYSDVYVTEENDHSCNVSYALNNVIINKLKTRLPNLHTVKFWSDGCGSQFRSQFAFYMMTRFDPAVNIEWNFFEANHGKGSVDGLGGSVKHAVYRLVLSQKLVIKSPEHFAEVADKSCPAINVQYVETKDLDLQYHEACRQLARPVKDTLQVHHVRRTVSDIAYQLDFFRTSTTPEILTSMVYSRNSYYISSVSSPVTSTDAGIVPKMIWKIVH
jgi:hypothetical protein